MRATRTSGPSAPGPSSAPTLVSTPVSPLRPPFAQWLGGPSYVGTDATSVCTEVLLSVCCRPAGSEEGGSGAAAEVHQWLQHAFNLDQPKAGGFAAPGMGCDELGAHISMGTAPWLCLTLGRAPSAGLSHHAMPTPVLLQASLPL